MKALRTSVFCIIALLLTLLASCTLSVTSSAHSGGQAHLSLSVGDGLARSIAPNDITEDDIISAYLKIESNGTEITGRPWYSDSENNKTALDAMQESSDIYLTPGTYTFTLELYVEMENYGWALCQRAVLQDKLVVSGENELVFAAEYASDASGTLSLAFIWSEDDRISDIQVGLFTSESDGEVEVEGYGLGSIWRGDENQIAEYAQWIPMGEYFLRIDIYGDTKYGQEKINTIEETVRILPGRVTEETIQLSNINSLYTITYNLNDGWWASGFEPVEWRNALKGVTLPTASDIERTGYQFLGWYETEDFSGKRISAIPSGTTGDTTVYARFVVNSVSSVDISDIVTVDGKEYAQYSVSSESALKTIIDVLNADTTISTENICISLDSDITVSSDYTPYGYDGTGSATSSQFEGVFDGGGHTITIGAVASESFTPICRANSGIIQNVKITLASGTSISTNNRDGIGDYNNFGGICEENAGIIRNCWVDLGTVDVHLFLKSGGICCGNSGTVVNCLNTTNMVCTFDNGSIAWAGQYGGVGGIVGMHEGGTIINCVNYGQITIATTYESGNNINGFSGAICSKQPAGAIKNCYWRENCLYTDTEQTTLANYIVYNSSVSGIREGTFTGNGYFADYTDGTLTAGDATTSVTAQTLEYGSNLLSALNAYASTDSNLSTWVLSSDYAAVLDIGD